MSCLDNDVSFDLSPSSDLSSIHSSQHGGWERWGCQGNKTIHCRRCYMYARTRTNSRMRNPPFSNTYLAICIDCYHGGQDVRVIEYQVNPAVSQVNGDPGRLPDLNKFSDPSPIQTNTLAFSQAPLLFTSSPNLKLTILSKKKIIH